ncbi:RNA-binding S4 domain-containing protein [Sedimentitalea todarodis]|uniref:RNA-binding S4 domain-containing protein n=1 Tax=Sedimentitalea todarodis TaxID=1631240 RepID=A0ABU3V9E2_9RHOB|nr:RNA-binding S4 domain-containing protein [Sedimentitalea todarodis]MDU9002713.1 RNA-binding S4 domain-containing protein [Sedimentitalea todarodis]
MSDTQPDKQRLDKWLWHARFFKTRTLSAKQVSGGHVRVNGERTVKPAYGIAPGDILAFAQARRARVIKIVELGVRRGPADEAQALYDDLAPPEPREPLPERVGERPTKKDRRALDALRGGQDGDF